MTTGTAEVTRVEDLEELLRDEQHQCEVNEFSGRCKEQADVLIRFHCGCAPPRTAWVCEHHYQRMRNPNPPDSAEYVFFSCGRCRVPIDTWREA